MATKRQNDVSVWQDALERSAKVRDKKKKEAMIYIELYKSNQWMSVKTKLREKPTINLLFAYVKTQLPYLCFQNPKWFVTPTGPRKREFAENSNLVQYFLNYYAEENMGVKLKRQLRLGVLDAFFWFGVIKSGYLPTIEVKPEYKKKYIKNPDGSRDLVYIDKTSGEIVTEPEEIVTNEKFMARRRSPASMLFDLEAESDFHDGRFIAEEINLPLDDVKADKKYSNTADLQATYEVKTSESKLRKELRNNDEDDDTIKRVTIYEIYDLEHDKLITLAKGHEKALRSEKTPKGIDGDPYSFLNFNDIPDQPYPLSDMKALKSPQEEYNKGYGMISEHAKRFLRKYAYVQGMIDQDQLDALEDPIDGLMFKVKELPLAKVIEPLQDAPIDSSAPLMTNMSLMNFREVSGSTEQDRGLVERRKTAYEASKITEASGIRKQDRRSLVEDWAGDVGSKLLISIQANMTLKDVIAIAGKDGQRDWKEMTREQLRGNYNVTTIVGSMTPKLPELERQDFMEVMRVLAMFPPEMLKIYCNFESLLLALPRMFPAIENIEFINSPEQIKFAKEQATKEKQIQYLMAMMGSGGGAAGPTGNQPMKKLPKKGEK